jgi:hypothetical protein
MKTTRNIAKPFRLELNYRGKHYLGTAHPLVDTCHDGICEQLEIHLNGKRLGILKWEKKRWIMEEIKEQSLVEKLGELIIDWYE